MIIEKLRQAQLQTGTTLCVGLDPILARLPKALPADAQGAKHFLRAIVDATCDLACAFKPQIAHFAGQDLLPILRDTIAYVREKAPHALVILDAKRSDIGSTAEYYAREAFDVYQADAVTVNPYMGLDTIEPFLQEGAATGVFALCRTSNPGSADFQDFPNKDEPLYLEVARKLEERFGATGRIGLVVGATHPEELARVREACQSLPFLIPGIGAQGGDASTVLAAAGSTSPNGLAILNVSRGLLYASGAEDYAAAARKVALELRSASGKYLAKDA